MKEFVKEIKNIYNKMSTFQVENDANGEVLTRDELMLHSIHLVQRWADIERALGKLETEKVKDEYKSIPFHWEVMDKLVDYIQEIYPSIYNEACDKVEVFRDEAGSIISKEEYTKIHKKEYEDVSK